MIEFITKDDFNELRKLDEKYWSINRWNYISDVVDILKEHEHQFENCLELGAYMFSIAKNQHTMDKCSGSNPTYLYDANVLPWNIKDKQYDLFIGLQVLEHLKNKKAIFDEIKRISNYAIISLPYRWECKDVNDCHHMIDENIIFNWFNMEPSISNIKEQRIINFYRF
jgi:hypothetical protein